MITVALFVKTVAKKMPEIISHASTKQCLLKRTEKVWFILLKENFIPGLVP